MAAKGLTACSLHDAGYHERGARYPKTWAAEDLKTWSMDCDLDDHPYWDLTSNCCGCVGWYPESPGPEWFLLGIFDTEDGPHVQ